MSVLLFTHKKFGTSRYKFSIRYFITIFKKTPKPPNVSHITRIGSLESKDFEIPVPWGIIAAKRWGTRNGKPVLAIHGWQDNAGTFDLLAPLLPRHWDLVCIDLPGHGLSSKYQQGHLYYVREYIGAIIRTLKFLNWNHFDYVGHSLGAALGMLFACLYPGKIDHLVNLELIKGYTDDNNSPNMRRAIRFCCLMRLQFEQDIRDNKMAPIYTMDEAIEKWYKGCHGSVTRDSIKVLFKRGVTVLPDGRVQYNRDRKLVLPPSAMSLMSTEQYRMFIKFLTCKFLIIKGKPGGMYEPQKLYDEMLSIHKKCCKLFKYVEVEGTHHLHLNTPEYVSEYVVDFIK